MKKIAFLWLLLSSYSTVFSQNETHKNVTDTFIMQFNQGDFEKIYQSFSEKMQKARSKEQYYDFFARVKKEYGTIQQIVLIQYQENAQSKSRAQYNATLENGNLILKISVNKQGEIIGLFMLKDKNIF